METVKNTVSHVLGTSRSSDPETTTDSTVGHNTGTTATTGTTGYDSGSTAPTTDTTGASAPTVHDQTTTETGNTASYGTTGTSATTGGDTSLGRDTTTTTGTADRTGAFSEHSGARDETLGADTIGATTDTTGTTADNTGTSTGATGTTSGTTSSSDITRGRDTKTEDSSDSHHKHHDPHEVQSPSQGPDPALVGDAKEHPKLTGQGVPGSHSAVFGLTPDGKKYSEASHGTTPVKPAHSDETSLGKKSVSGASGADSAGDTVSGGHGGVSDQIDAPDQGKKGLERKDPVPQSEAQGDGKPGAGLTGLKQGSGQV